MKVLIDTCIILDALQARKPFHSAAEKIFLLSAGKAFEGFITVKAATDIYYITHRLTHSDPDTRKILASVFTLFSPLDTAGIDCRKAILSTLTDYEDAVMLETAIRSGIDCIVTRNVKDYAKSSLPIYTPDAFISLCQGEP